MKYDWQCPRCGSKYQFPAAPVPGSGGKAFPVDRPCTRCLIEEGKGDTRHAPPRS